MRLDLLAPETLADPFPVLHRLRAEDPVHWEPEPGFWAVSRYDDAVAVLKNPDVFSSAIHATGRNGVDTAERRPDAGLATAGWFVFQDAPAHTRLRGGVSAAFTPQAVEALRPRVAALVAELLDAVEDVGRCDLVADVAFPLPAIVIAELLGVPATERARFRQWSADLAAVGGLVRAARDGAVRLARARASVEALRAYFRHVARERRRMPRADLVSRLLATGPLDEAEVVDTCVFLLFAGHETTTNLIGNGALALLRHPDALSELRETPGLLAAGLEELLRFDGPVAVRVRVARADVVLRGRQIRRGDRVLVLLGGANRDPAQFPDPDRLWLARPDNRHLAFGHGMHFCLGAALARLEGGLAIDALVRRFPALALASETVTWRPTMTLRGLEGLPLALR